jgi:hypothetical protein
MTASTLPRAITSTWIFSFETDKHAMPAARVELLVSQTKEGGARERNAVKAAQGTLAIAAHSGARA